MTTYFHLIPTELVLLVTDYLSDQDKMALPEKLIIYRDENAFNLRYPEFYKQILVPFKKYYTFTEDDWYSLNIQKDKFVKYFRLVNGNYVINKELLKNKYEQLPRTCKLIFSFYLMPELIETHVKLHLQDPKDHNRNRSGTYIVDLYDRFNFWKMVGKLRYELRHIYNYHDTQLEQMMINITKKLDPNLIFEWKNVKDFIGTTANNYIFLNSTPLDGKGILVTDFLELLDKKEDYKLKLIQESKYRYNYGINKQDDEYLIKKIFSDRDSPKIYDDRTAKEKLNALYTIGSTGFEKEIDFLYNDGFLLADKKLFKYFLPSNVYRLDLQDPVVYLQMAILENNLNLVKWLQSNAFRYEYGSNLESDGKLLTLLGTLVQANDNPKFLEQLITFFFKDGFTLAKPEVLQSLSELQIAPINIFEVGMKLNNLDILEYLQKSKYALNPKVSTLDIRILLNKYEYSLNDEVLIFLENERLLSDKSKEDYINDFNGDEDIEYFEEPDDMDFEYTED